MYQTFSRKLQPTKTTEQSRYEYKQFQRQIKCLVTIHKNVMCACAVLPYRTYKVRTVFVIRIKIATFITGVRLASVEFVESDSVAFSFNSAKVGGGPSEGRSALIVSPRSPDTRVLRGYKPYAESAPLPVILLRLHSRDKVNAK